MGSQAVFGAGTISLRRHDLALLVSAFAPPAPLRVLELGCGKGQNVKLFAERGDFYTGMDRSLDDLRPTFRAKGAFLIGDYCEVVPRGFDLIFERASFVCNSDDALERAIRNIYEALDPGGMFISADLYMAGNPNLPNANYRTFTVEGARDLFAPFETVHLADTKALHRIDFVGRKH